MAKTDNKILSQFVTRAGMFIRWVEEKNVVSFIHRYEAGLYKSATLRNYQKNGLPTSIKLVTAMTVGGGQIYRLSTKRSLSWVAAFNMIASEILEDEHHEGLGKRNERNR